MLIETEIVFYNIIINKKQKGPNLAAVAFQNLFLLAEMLKQVQQDKKCHSDAYRNLLIFSEMLK